MRSPVNNFGIQLPHKGVTKILLVAADSKLYSRGMKSRSRAKSVSAILVFLLAGALAPTMLLADVPTGDKESAIKYYRLLAKTLGFSTPEKIFQTTLDDVAAYLGYTGITGADLQNLPSAVLMSPEQLLTPTVPPRTPSDTLQHFDVVAGSPGAIPIRPDDILVTRFFAPKIINIKDPEQTRKLGWRKLVRLRARTGSVAQKHHIGSGIILFNFLTPPGASPFGPTEESLNTQVMLITDTFSVPEPGIDGPATLYWLDYDKLSKGGALSFALNQSFDANELSSGISGLKDYFVPDGCVACHGSNDQRSMVNYLDTDHWIDRLNNDFSALKTNGLPLLFDAGTNNTASLAYKFAFDVIRRFNIEADEQVRRAQPKHDESLASQKWLELHASSNEHSLPLDRAIGAEPRWSSQSTDDGKVLDALNQYCFRCHGTVKFSVFNRQEMHLPRMVADIGQRLKPDAPDNIKMPPDRELPESVRALILHNLIP